MISKLNSTLYDCKPWENNVLTHNQNILNSLQQNLVTYERKYKVHQKNFKIQLPKIKENLSPKYSLSKEKEEKYFTKYIPHQKLKTLHQSLELVKEIRQAQQKEGQRKVQSVLSERIVSNVEKKALKTTRHNLQELLTKRQDEEVIIKKRSLLKYKQMFANRNISRQNLRLIMKKIDSKENMSPFSSRRYDAEQKDIPDAAWLLINFKQNHTTQGRLKKRELHKLVFGPKHKN